eukprot:gene10373-biopygen15327
MRTAARAPGKRMIRMDPKGAGWLFNKVSQPTISAILSARLAETVEARQSLTPHLNTPCGSVHNRWNEHGTAAKTNLLGKLWAQVRDASGTHLPLGNSRAGRARCRFSMTSTGTMKGWKAASSTLSAQTAFNANRSLSVVQYNASGPPPGSWKSTVSTCDTAFLQCFTWAAPAAPP